MPATFRALPSSSICRPMVVFSMYVSFFSSRLPTGSSPAADFCRSHWQQPQVLVDHQRPRLTARSMCRRWSSVMQVPDCEAMTNTPKYTTARLEHLHQVTGYLYAPWGMCVACCIEHAEASQSHQHEAMENVLHLRNPVVSFRPRKVDNPRVLSPPEHVLVSVQLRVPWTEANTRNLIMKTDATILCTATKFPCHLLQGY